MAHASIQDIAASWDQYLRFLKDLTRPAPAGLILYAAGPTDEGVKVLTVWDGPAACERFRRTRLGPALAALGGPVAPFCTARDLALAHVVLGDGPPTPELQEEPAC